MLAVAVRRDQACAICLQGRRLRDWTVSHKAARSPKAALEVLGRWMAIYRPEIVISQNPDSAARKSPRNRAILRAIARAIADDTVLDLLVTRTMRHDNIYEEAAAIAARYPALRHKLPGKPKIWETEPRRIIYFEAMALALQVLDGK